MIEKWQNEKLRMTIKVRDPRLSPIREQEIADLAEAIAAEHFRTSRVEPSAIIKSKGISISFGRYEDYFDGLLEHRHGRFHIFANLDRVEHAEES